MLYLNEKSIFLAVWKDASDKNRLIVKGPRQVGKAEGIIKNISRTDPLTCFIEGETLIFFDKLQEFPDITTALKFFKPDGRFDVICSSSMMGIHH